MTGGINTNVPRESMPSENSHVSILSKSDALSGSNKSNVIIVWMVVCFGAVGGILFGMDQANFAGVEHKRSFINTFCNNETNSSGSWGNYEECKGGRDIDVPSGMTNFQAWGSSLIQLGAAFGALLIAPFITKSYGRRAGLSSGCLVVLLAMIWCVLESKVWPFYITRFITGVGVGMVTFTLPMWTAELAPKNIRGTLGCTMQLACVIGSQVAFGINIPEGVTWQWSLAAPIIPAAIVVLFIFMFPESPRFLMKKNGVQAAKETLIRLRGTDAVNEELNEIEESIMNERSEAPWSTLWTDPSIRKRVIIANMLQWMQQFTGINALLGQGTKIFINAGVPIDENVASFITNAFNLIGTIIMMIIVDKKGRRILLLTGAVAMFIFMFSAGCFSYYIDRSLNDEVGGYLILISCCLYFLGFAIAWGGIPWVYPSEIFPMDVKEKALSTSVCSQWLANFLVAQITPRQIDNWGASATFFFYAAFIFMSFVFVYFYVPEIKGVAMEEMDNIFGKRNNAHKDAYAKTKTPSMNSKTVKTLV